ncbi:histidine phosphatase family protein [Bifidobacterium psychraerophilum]|uniref:histidine phosphatase family protein n=1 Tax=Bifidobacterium psychraerophilum TaxID=218140 RepID=UPI0023F38582|nr:histidine phosphatase family protein [Bifidobacterium psychraerophilum]MCI1659836.1 histidine phosphatase family protein [Bifidobacterium psychraerophilum]MCI1805260.1 histidine phosphatase family protein [Bifidobacterium psychraerophilum]MCI2177243.1 histidine phosphatase family protein [Bifidobacterium psychraerophilum]MCI2182394.1 histidine phosphatase family protein [Bifidobacterium psychraerophilum]
MTTTKVSLVRHGEVFNPEHVLYERLPGFHLSDRGQRMARATARYIAQQPSLNKAVAVFSSPLDRTRETSQAILEALNEKRAERDAKPLNVVLDDRIIEAGNEFRGKRIGHGDGAVWRKGNIHLLRNLWKPSWGETYQQIAQRVGDFVYEKVDEYPGEHIIVVSHESPIWTFRHLLEKGRAEHNMMMRHTGLASVTTITFDDATKLPIAIEYADPAASVI